MQKAQCNDYDALFLANMKTVTSHTTNDPHASSTHQRTAQYNNLSENSASQNIRHPHVPHQQQQQWESQQQLEMIESSKYMMFQSCSTEGTQPDQEGANKENMQMWSEPYQNTKRSNRRSPLKDITSKMLAFSLKKDKSTLTSQLNAYMNSLFPSASSAGTGYRAGKLLRI